MDVNARLCLGMWCGYGLGARDRGEAKGAGSLRAPGAFFSLLRGAHLRDLSGSFP